MPSHCPHCRFPFDPDWDDDALPALCPRCGERIAAPSANNPRAGIATFLRKPVEAPAPAEPMPADETAAPAAPESAQTATATPVDGATTTSPASRPSDDPPPAPSPSFTRHAAEPATSSRAALWQWIALGLLLLALPLQLLLADRARLAADAGWRPLLASLCGALRCELPPWREPQAFTMIERDVRPVPGSPGELQVRATFRNDARWAQAWPRLQLSLADADGRTVGARGFEPREYLGRVPAATLASGQSAQIAFRIREPAAPAAAFQFEFR